MSGLAALFQRDGRPVQRQAIAAMLAAAPYRGPDGMRVHLWDCVALGHAKFAVTPEESAEQQPLISARTGCAVIADARLDNREELLGRLPDRPPASASDAELILRAYEVWGADAPVYLLGDFAFAIWDPGRQRLLCARDTSAQRALYYRLDRRTFAAASEIQQLLQDPSVPVAPNEERIRDSLAPFNRYRNEKDRPDTFFEGILALPAGHLLLVDADAARVEQYWHFERPRELRYRRDEEYAEHYRALFFDVVRARLRTTHPIGVLLSGGLDSSSIACTAQQLYRDGRAADHGFRGFTFTFGELDCDEQPLVEDMRAQYGFDVRYVTSRQFGGRLQLEPRGFREAPNLGIAEARDAILGAASQLGTRVLLTGDLGDACIFGSRLVFDSLLRRGNLKAFARHLRAYRRVSQDSLRRIVGLYCLAPLLPLELEKRVISAHMRRAFAWYEPRLLPPWMPEAMRAELSRRHLRLALAAEEERRFANPTLEAEYRLLYPPEIARHPVPWPLELWRPFADRRLHEFVLAIPPEQKFEPHPETDEYYAGSKRIVRRAMRGVLPESIRTRTTKTVFGAVWDQEIKRQWHEYAAAFGPSARPEIAQRGYVDQGRFWSRLQELRDEGTGNDFVYVMGMVELETWLQSLKQPRAQLVAMVPPPGNGSASLGLHREVEVLGATA